MKFRPLTWLLLSVMFFVAALLFWRLGDKWEAERKVRSPKSEVRSPQSAVKVKRPKASAPVPGAPLELLSKLGDLPSPQGTNQPPKHVPFKYRLSNSSKTVGQLARTSTGI